MVAQSFFHHSAINRFWEVESITQYWWQLCEDFVFTVTGQVQPGVNRIDWLSLELWYSLITTAPGVPGEEYLDFLFIWEGRGGHWSVVHQSQAVPYRQSDIACNTYRNKQPNRTSRWINSIGRYKLWTDSGVAWIQPCWGHFHNGGILVSLSRKKINDAF